VRASAPDIEITSSSQSPPKLADALLHLAILRRETHRAGLAFKFLIKEPLVPILPVTIAWPRGMRKEHECRLTPEPPERGARHHVLLEIAADDAKLLRAFGFHAARIDGIYPDFFGANSFASTRVAGSSAPLVAEYTTAVGIGFWLAIELILMTLPPSGPKYLGASRDPKSAPSTLI
jgi:hypothetical protein